jgi:hypothetical protein
MAWTSTTGWADWAPVWSRFWVTVTVVPMSPTASATAAIAPSMMYLLDSKSKFDDVHYYISEY